MVNFSPNVKKSLFKNLLKKEDFFERQSPIIINFLDEIWDLRSMPSSDDRYDNAYKDTVQHIVNNNDWTFEYLFLEKLDLYKDDDIFRKFIETLVKPEYRNSSQSNILDYVNIINEYIKENGLQLVIIDYDENGLPLYFIKTKSEVQNLPSGTKFNNIPFIVISDYSGRGDRKVSEINNTDSYKEYKESFFILYFESGWNDFDIMSKYYLYYFSEEAIFIGATKIVLYDEEIENTNKVIGKEFLELNENFCSLGQSISYYENLKRHLKKDFESVLYALKDAAFFPFIQEKFEKRKNFLYSLVREDQVERLLREIRYIIDGLDLKKLYSFTYKFTPAFSGDNIQVNFDFNSELDIPNRIYAIIGKNGTGKTQLISSLPIDLSNKNDSAFIPNVPLFSKVIAVSYSIFDRYNIPKKTAKFNYIHCGLRNEDGDFITPHGLVMRFHNSWKRIVELSRTDKWRKILLTFIESEVVEEFLILKENSSSSRPEYDVNIGKFGNVKDKLSSGQGIVLYIVTEIIANIRFDSLIIYDEPETHLHPNAISQLINTIYELVNEFESYCILATHSPLIIREILSRSVYVIERNGNNSSVRRISIESFGENLSSITDEVFGNRSIKKQSKSIFQRLVDEGKSFEDIIKLLEFDNVQLSLNARILIKSLIKGRNEEY